MVFDFSLTHVQPKWPKYRNYCDYVLVNVLKAKHAESSNSFKDKLMLPSKV